MRQRGRGVSACLAKPLHAWQIEYSTNMWHYTMNCGTLLRNSGRAQKRGIPAKDWTRHLGGAFDDDVRQHPGVLLAQGRQRRIAPQLAVPIVLTLSMAGQPDLARPPACPADLATQQR